MLIQSDDSLAEKIGDAHGRGYRLEVHAIGDRAAESVLRGLESHSVPASARPIITHCQLLGADLIRRMAEGGVIANIQPSFVVTDAPFARRRLDAQTQEHAYVWKTLLASGVRCAGGSDAPVESPRPLLGMHDAIFRRAHGAPLEAAYKPEQCLSFSEALALYTVGAAFADGAESTRGKIAAGMAADLVVLDIDVSVDPSTLACAAVEQTWVAGRRRYDRASGGVLGLDGGRAVLPPPPQPACLPNNPGKNGPRFTRIPHSHGCCSAGPLASRRRKRGRGHDDALLLGQACDCGEEEAPRFFATFLLAPAKRSAVR